jgi:hypothetical protein
MAYRFTPADRGAFKRCRRQWDLGARERQNYEPARPAGLDLDLAVRDALAVYYFPGMWDWQRAVVLPLVLQGFARSMRRQQAAEEDLGPGMAMLRRYFDWAPGVDRFSPIQVESRFEVNLPDPDGPDRELVLADGRPIRYQGRLDLLASDEHDRFWVVGHRLVDRFTAIGDLLLDEELVAAGWAVERSYPGMRVAGTVHNELRIDPAGPTHRGGNQHPPEPPQPLPAQGWRRRLRRPVPSHQRGIPQHEASGGGRSLPYHRRRFVQAGAARAEAVTTQGNQLFRRTQVRREPAELQDMGARLAAEALDMVDPGLRLYPSPSPEHCGGCQFVAPCLAMEQGGDVEAVLAAGYRDRGPERVEPGRLGGATWGTGRGAAPPRFDP